MENLLNSSYQDKLGGYLRANLRREFDSYSDLVSIDIDFFGYQAGNGKTYPLVNLEIATWQHPAFLYNYDTYIKILMKNFLDQNDLSTNAVVNITYQLLILDRKRYSSKEIELFDSSEYYDVLSNTNDFYTYKSLTYTLLSAPQIISPPFGKSVHDVWEWAKTDQAMGPEPEKSFSVKQFISKFNVGQKESDYIYLSGSFRITWMQRTGINYPTGLTEYDYGRVTFRITTRDNQLKDIDVANIAKRFAATCTRINIKQHICNFNFKFKCRVILVDNKDISKKLDEKEVITEFYYK